MARLDRANLINMADAYGGNAGLVRQLGYQRGAPGSPERQAYSNALRAIQRATTTKGKERHTGINSRALRQRIAQRVDPVRVLTAIAQREWRRRHTGPPDGIAVEATYHISDDTRHRMIHLPLDDPALAERAMRPMDRDDLADLIGDLLREDVEIEDYTDYDYY